jgi:hypothetical protein
MVARRRDGIYEPPIVCVLLSYRKYDTPRTMWNRMRVRKKVTANAMLLLSEGCNVMKPKKKVGTSIAAHRQNMCDHDLLMANSTIPIYMV